MWSQLVEIYLNRNTFRSKKNEPRHDKTNKMSVRPAKTQISLGIRPVWSESSRCPVWSESSLCAQWVAKDPMLLHADSEDSDQTMPRLTGWSESLLSAQPFLLLLFFFHEAAQMFSWDVVKRFWVFGTCPKYLQSSFQIDGQFLIIQHNSGRFHEKVLQYREVLYLKQIRSFTIILLQSAMSKFSALWYHRRLFEF